MFGTIDQMADSTKPPRLGDVTGTEPDEAAYKLSSSDILQWQNGLLCSTFENASTLWEQTNKKDVVLEGW